MAKKKIGRPRPSSRVHNKPVRAATPAAGWMRSTRNKTPHFRHAEFFYEQELRKSTFFFLVMFLASDALQYIIGGSRRLWK